jgi:hypothetical protein
MAIWSSLTDDTLMAVAELAKAWLLTPVDNVKFVASVRAVDDPAFNVIEVAPVTAVSSSVHTLVTMAPAGRL